MMESCPKCDSLYVSDIEDVIKDDKTTQIWECNECGCRWQWESTRTIIDEPTNEDVFNRRLQEVKHAKDEEARILNQIEEEEEFYGDGC